MTTFRYHGHGSFYFLLFFLCLACLLQIMCDNWILCFFVTIGVGAWMCVLHCDTNMAVV